VTDYKDEAGDLIQYYDPAQANATIQTLEKQRPNAFLGYHHEWSPGVHTLFLAGRLHDDFTATNSIAPTLTLIRDGLGNINNVVVSPVNPNSASFRNGFNSEFVTYSAELQQIWQTEKHTLIFGGRYQNGDVQTSDLLDIRALSAFSGNYLVPASLTNVAENLERASGYLYYHWQIAKQLQLIGGLTYDYLAYPQNTDYSPISEGERDKDQWSPKVGAVWSPLDSTTVRAAYTKSLGGLFFDNSVRLEPTQVAGFTQAYRSLVPESVSGPIAGAEFETIGIALDQKLWRGGYLGITGETLKSDADRTVGAFQKTGPLTVVAFPFAPKATVTSTRQSLSYEENTLRASFNQLLGDEWALGATYRYTYAQLTDLYLDIPSTALNNPSSNRDATLQQVNLTAIYNHRCGFFGRWDSLWSHQVNSDLPSEAFWQHNVYIGYRFLQRRVEARVGILNLTDQDYRLNPLTLYSELMRERTFIANFRFMF
jgi:outer membrane receptor protein involved in Fe transport